MVMLFLSGTVKMIAHTAAIGFDWFNLESLSESAIHVCRRTEQTWEKESEAPIDDGHQWRKYGQKEILSAKFPRLDIYDHTWAYYVPSNTKVPFGQSSRQARIGK